MTEKTLYVFDTREPVWKSWLRDAGTFGMLAGTGLATNTLMPPSGWINFCVSFGWLIWILGRPLKLKMLKTPAQAREWLDQEFPEQEQLA